MGPVVHLLTQKGTSGPTCGLSRGGAETSDVHLAPQQAADVLARRHDPLEEVVERHDAYDAPGAIHDDQPAHLPVGHHLERDLDRGVLVHALDVYAHHFPDLGPVRLQPLRDAPDRNVAIGHDSLGLAGFDVYLPAGEYEAHFGSSRGHVLGAAEVVGDIIADLTVPGFVLRGRVKYVGTKHPLARGPEGEVVIAAADERGVFGAPAMAELIAVPEDVPVGELVIELGWEGNADLDLHVVEPGPFGGEVFADDPNSFEPVPGEPIDPDEPPKHGILDRDGNHECERMPHPSEHAIWAMPPPAGEYVVRVDAPSLCGDGSAAWYVAAYRTINGVTELLGSARGTATPDHVLQPRGRGAGITALRFTL